MVKTVNTPATDETKLLIANTFIASLKANDWPGLHALLEPDAHWTLPGRSLLSGLANGGHVIVQRLQNLKKFGVNFDLKYILIGMNGFTLLLHNTSRRGELILDEQVAIVFGLTGEKIASMATYLSDVGGIEQFFVPGIID